MTDSRERRINARIDDELDRKLNYLRERTNQSTTGVLREAVTRYHATVSRASATPAEVFADTGFVGCVDGPRDLSASYKDMLARSLARKT